MIYYLHHFRLAHHKLLSATAVKMPEEELQSSMSKEPLDEEYIAPNKIGEPLRMESFHTSRPVDRIHVLQLFSKTKGYENIMVHDIMEMRLFKHNLVLDVIKYDGTSYSIDFVSWHELKTTARALAEGRVARHSKYPTLVTNLMACWFPYRELIVLRRVPKPDELRAQREKLHAELQAQFQTRAKAIYNENLITIPEEDYEQSRIEVFEIPENDNQSGETSNADEDMTILHVETFTQKEMFVVEVPPLHASSCSSHQFEDQPQEAVLNNNQMKVEVCIESPQYTPWNDTELHNMLPSTSKDSSSNTLDFSKDESTAVGKSIHQDAN